MDIIQQELDKAEEYVLNKIFEDINNIQIGTKLQLFFLAKNIKFEDFLNEKIKIFEEIAKDFMTPNGYFDGNKITEAIAIKYPSLRGYVVLPTLKPLEYAKILDSIVGFDAVRQLLK